MAARNPMLSSVLCVCGRFVTYFGARGRVLWLGVESEARVVCVSWSGAFRTLCWPHES
jgi:hypothetical protein